jgi:hypothetical protein
MRARFFVASNLELEPECSPGEKRVEDSRSGAVESVLRGRARRGRFCCIADFAGVDTEAIGAILLLRPLGAE